MQTTYVNGFNYAASGAPTSYWYGNGLAHSFSYNNRLQPATVYDQTLLLSLGFNWGTTNNNGNLQGITQANSGPGWQVLTFNQSFNYDGVNRLTSASDSGGWSQSYGYDAWGNRWLASNNGVPQNGSTPTSNVFNMNNQMTGATYDGNGNQTTANGDALTFDAENRLITVVESASLGGGTEAIQYDGNDHRINKTSGNSSTAYIYDAFGQLVYEYATGALPASPCSTCYLSMDQLGTPRLVTDPTGNVVARHDYLPFGEEIATDTGGRIGIWSWGSAYDTVNQKFTGKERDAESGLDYFDARYYGSALGRWTSPDEPFAEADLGNPQALSLYTHGRNNPLRYTDQDGRRVRVCLNDGQTCTTLSDSEYAAARQNNPGVYAPVKGRRIFANKKRAQFGMQTKIRREEFRF